MKKLRKSTKNHAVYTYFDIQAACTCMNHCVDHYPQQAQFRPSQDKRSY